MFKQVLVLIVNQEEKQCRINSACPIIHVTILFAFSTYINSNYYREKKIKRSESSYKVLEYRS